uniref:RanBD1 domain-containing protein n=1 Tax=Panagrolaimus sp. PS1159 TaxID=55785 RepID=A0AC35FJG1_9BILA
MFYYFAKNGKGYEFCDKHGHACCSTNNCPAKCTKTSAAFAQDPTLDHFNGCNKDVVLFEKDQIQRLFKLLISAIEPAERHKKEYYVEEYSCLFQKKFNHITNGEKKKAAKAFNTVIEESIVYDINALNHISDRFKEMIKESVIYSKYIDENKNPEDLVPDVHYEPVIPISDKVDTVTGEECTKTLFNNRCKLYIFNSETKEVKERGVGDLKVLYNPEKKSYRVVMRREQVHKICANFSITKGMNIADNTGTNNCGIFNCV